MAETTQLDQAIIFINYRRTDAGWPADLLASRLKAMFGEPRVFLDVRGFDAGDDFAAVLEERLRRATVLIVLIGEHWLHAQDRFGRRRLDQPHDWVRREIRTALENRHCRVIPVLLDDAELPDEKEALPDDISVLLSRQRIRVRQTNSDDDIAALSKVLERAGFRRLDDVSGGAFGVGAFSDRDVNDIVRRLRQLHEQQGVEFLAARELFPELDQLFNRKTFRFEALRRCPEQRWGDRLDSAYQTLHVLQGYMRNVRATAADKYRIYRDLVAEVDKYCMQMGALLFDPSVDYNRIEAHIGKTTFKAHLPQEIRFAAGPDKQPEIPDAINDEIDPHRSRAVALMDQLLGD
ncbi:MAG: toll/interleukin-1 receptor domain-containing protein [Gemmatimonadaceae bacterium]